MKHETYELPLANGGRLAVIHVPGSPIFHLEVHVNSGYRYAKKSHYELPHLLEHLAFEGSKRFPDPRALRYELEKYGIYQNAYTSFNRNGYEFYSAKEYIDHIIDLGYEWFLEPTLREEAITQQKQVVENELTQHIANAEGQIGYALHQSLKNQQVLSWKKRIATMQSITRDDIVSYHQGHYYPANLLHIITGDLPRTRVKHIKQMIEVKLPAAAKKQPLAAAPVLPKPPKSLRIYSKYPHKDAVRFTIEFTKPGFDETFDAKHFTALQIYKTILGEGMYSRLFIKTRETGLTYSIGTYLGASREYSYFEIADKVPPKNVLPLVQLVFEQMRAVADGGFSDEELDRAVGYQIGRHATRFQTAMNYLSWYEDVYTQGMPLLTPDDVLAELKQVTRESVIEAAVAFFGNPSLQRRLGVASYDKVDPALEQLVADFAI